MLDKHHLEGWVMALDLVGQYLEMQFSKELFQMALEIWAEGPRCAQGRGTWCWLALPPLDGGIDGLKRQSTIRLLDVVGETSKSIAQGKTSIMGSKHLGLFKSSLGQRKFRGRNFRVTDF